MPRQSFRLSPKVLLLTFATGTLALLVATGLPACSASPATQPRYTGERVPSDDPAIWNLHSLGLVNGRTNIFRSACPLRDFVKKPDASPEDPAIIAEADTRMKRLHALGIRTIVSYESNAEPETAAQKNSARWTAAEKDAAARAGIAFVLNPLTNSGPGSLETLSSTDVVKTIDPLVTDLFNYSGRGGVLFHCAAGRDRTGVIAAYIRLKYQHWTAEQAIDEMRRYGHDWTKFSHNGGVSSWHEDHIRAMAPQLAPPKTQPRN